MSRRRTEKVGLVHRERTADPEVVALVFSMESFASELEPVQFRVKIHGPDLTLEEGIAKAQAILLDQLSVYHRELQKLDPYDPTLYIE
ncbi:MAG: hypothetical protein OXF62_11300 [Caldilineaceae bacterium]|nr:hypothetical protein [Caldilineaceae bacterium]